ncbi:hypothetical protein [Caenispirillum salinarum]|uniref:hypothetical protein n=1 Tax=Caenispirillum salinarum TaxID=859058 RepID=UPI00384AE01A
MRWQTSICRNRRTAACASLPFVHDVKEREAEAPKNSVPSDWLTGRFPFNPARRGGRLLEKQEIVVNLFFLFSPRRFTRTRRPPASPRKAGFLSNRPDPVNRNFQPALAADPKAEEDTNAPRAVA